MNINRDRTGHALRISHLDLENVLDQRNCNGSRLASVIQFWLDKQPSEVTWHTITTAVELCPLLEPSKAEYIMDMCLMTAIQAAEGDKCTNSYTI